MHIRFLELIICVCTTGKSLRVILFRVLYAIAGRIVLYVAHAERAYTVHAGFSSTVKSIIRDGDYIFVHSSDPSVLSGSRTRFRPRFRIHTILVFGSIVVDRVPDTRVLHRYGLARNKKTINLHA